MSDGQENRVAYPLIAGVCALVLVGGPIAAFMVWSASHKGKPQRHAVVSTREPDAARIVYQPVKQQNFSSPPSEVADEEKGPDPEETRLKELVRKLQEPKKTQDPEPSEPKPPKPKPVEPPSAVAEEKKADRKGSLSPVEPSAEEKMVQIIRAFIVRQLAHPDGFDIVDHTKPQRVKAVNKKPAQLMRVVFRAQDGTGRLGAHDFLFVVQKDEVVEHAPTAAYVAAQRARQQAMLQVALLNEAILKQQLQAGAGGGFSGPGGGFGRGPSGYVGGGGGGCIMRGG
jgi:hypothetical protein